MKQQFGINPNFTIRATTHTWLESQSTNVHKTTTNKTTTITMETTVTATITMPDSAKKPCNGCGSTTHGFNTKDRATKCDAWGKTCQNCGIVNHSASVCRQALKEKVSGIYVTPHSNTASGEINLIAHLMYDTNEDKYVPPHTTPSVEEISATLTVSHTTIETPSQSR